MADAFVPEMLGRRDASGQIARQLRTAISSGVWEPGERLPTELELADTFDVSRATAREALKLLSATGLVVSARGSHGGTFVSVPNAVDVAEQLSDSIGLWYRAGNVTLHDVDEARWVLEMHCVDLAARRRTPRDLEAIKAPVEASRDFNMDIADWLDLDLEFHTAITKAAKNQILELAMTAIHLSRPATNTVFVELLDRATVTDQHEAIYLAISDSDPQKAQEAFQRHVSYLDEVRRQALADLNASEVIVSTLPAIRHSAANRPIAAE
ncbi:FadR family transcriptional regulator [Cryobacterium algoritolerans]|uniref:FadR family transcriptional regulator n=1 Tax=Cryobacterium algoritolerans TaxID=1259184 RepID=A0A4R8X1F0_9MICO|nr:FadR/GntR family transcriptional regulator [Cryobacterium algoritolerans]TFC19730.1 FadR family transcriptional regulator [Cryobacterium algoritolerans]